MQPFAFALQAEGISERCGTEEFIPPLADLCLVGDERFGKPGC